MKLYQIKHYVNGELAESIILATDEESAVEILKEGTVPSQLEEYGYKVSLVDTNVEQLITTSIK